MRTSIQHALALGIAGLAAAAAALGARADGDKVRVVATLSHLASHAREVGADRVEVVSLTQGNQDPHFINPTPSLMVAANRANAFVQVGLDLELWAEHVIDGARNVDIRLGFPGSCFSASGVPIIEVPAVIDRSQGDVHPNGNPHVWFDPLNAAIEARNIADTLKRVDPGSAADHDKRYQAYKARLETALWGEELVRLLGAGTLTGLSRKNALLDFSERRLPPHLRRGLLGQPAQTWFIVIDSDSLLPTNALRLLASEVARNEMPPSILQLASIPTANFFAGGWFSRFVAFADAIGAVGKWARSTRRRLRPDLHAGSGVVVPGTLAAYVSERTGAPWTETTLTEDARLIVGQFGIMGGARNTTAMAPAYLLEAVPAQPDFSSTFRSYWNQRQRWTTGGYDEFFYILSAPDWVRFSRYDREAARWVEHPAGAVERVGVRLRQALRAGLWLGDHFLWGIGGAMVFTHWWIVSTAIAAPSASIAVGGLAALLAAPLLVLALPGRRLSVFVPGGLDLATSALLYALSFVGIRINCLPVVVTQIACLLGLRSRLLEWKPTLKPRYDAAVGNVIGPDREQRTLPAAPLR